jgi:heat shock protein HtpX
MDKSIYTHISNNKRETVVIIMAFIVIISLLGWFVGEFYSVGGYGFFGIAMIFSGITSFLSYYNSDKIVLAISNATEVKYQDSPDLHNLVDNLCIASGLPKPRIYIINDTAMNAFATGRDPEHAVICFTTGIVSKLEKRELEGVIAHEMAHIGNYDIRLMSIVSILVGTIALVSDWVTRGALYTRGRRNNQASGLIMIIGLLLMILSPIIATLIKLAMSRNREFLADSTGALITRNPHSLASALQKISQDPEILEAANSATAHMYISNPLKGNVRSLFNTHPPVQERIDRLMQM